jgi:glutathione S-transferase
MTYKLYYSPGACSMAVHIALEELEVAFDLVPIPVAQGATLQSYFLAINPKGRVPVLQIPSEAKVLTELPAILIYLAKQHPSGNLLPHNDISDEARCCEWLAWLAGWVHGMGFGEIWRPGRFSADQSCHEMIQANGRNIVLGAYRDIEQAFTDGRGWAVKFGYSIVDPFLLVLYRWGNRIGLDMRAGYPAWTGHAERLLDRQAVQRVLRREGITIDG